MSVLQYPENMNFKDLQIWDNAAFDNGESESSAAMKFSWSTMNPLSIDLSQSLESDSTKENQCPSMAESPVSNQPLAHLKPLQANTNIANTQRNPTSKLGSFEMLIHENLDQSCPGKEDLSKEKDLDSEIEKIEKEIHRLSLKLESLRLEKAKRSLKVMEKRGRIVAAKFMDPPKHGTKSSEEQSKIEESLSMSAKLKTPRRGLSLGPTEIMRGARRGISLGPAEIYSATKLKQMGKQDTTTPVHNTSNRRKSCYWKLLEIDELRATKERGKSLSLSPKSRSKTVPKAQPPKQATTTIGSRKTVKKDGVISSIQPKKLFVKDGEKSAPGKKPLKSGRVVASRYNQISNGGNSAMKELRKRSLNGNEEDCKRSDKKRVSLAGKPQGVEEQPATETRVKKKWEIPSEVANQKGVDHKTPLSVSKMLDMVPKIKTLRFMNESPRDSGAAKRASELVGKKSFFNMDDDDDDNGYNDDDDVEESVCQALEFTEEPVTKECPKIRLLRRFDESPQDSGAAKRVSEMIGKKSFFDDDDDDEMPVFSFEEEDEEN